MAVRRFIGVMKKILRNQDYRISRSILFTSSIPIAIEMLFRRGEWFRFTKWAALSGVVILAPMVWFDSVYFGKLVVAPLNIVTYNVFTSHGPDLYGTEPFGFYFLNGFLNFNFVFVGALLAPLGLVRPRGLLKSLFN